MKIISKNQQKTFELGTKIAKNLKGGDVLAVSGELGAGKTTFIKGLAAGLGVKQIVRSPSFNLLKVYPAKKLKLVHLDCYRLSKAEEAVDIGLLDFLGRPDTIVVVEWPEKIAALLKKYRSKKIKFEHLDLNRRKISLPFK